MALPTEYRRSIAERAKQLIHILRQVRTFAAEIVVRIDTNSLGARRLLQTQDNLTQNRSSIVTWQYGSLVAPEVKQRLIDEFDTYSTMAEVNADIQAANSAFAQMTADVEALLVVGRAAGQLTDNSSSTNLEIEFDFGDSPERIALRATAVAVRDSMAA